MSKRSFRGRPKPKKNKMPSAGGLMSQMQQMQEQMASAQSALENETLTVTAGGGAISIVITGHQRIESIKVDPELLTPEDAEMLQDMVLSAVNMALDESRALQEKLMGPLAGGMPF